MAPSRVAPESPELDFAPLATERLTLRPFRPGDEAALHRLINDWEVCRTLAAVPFPYSRALAAGWVYWGVAGREAGDTSRPFW